MSSQWLSLLSVLSSKDPRSPRGPQAPQIHRSTESTEPGSSPDLLDLSYAAMQITHSALILLYRQLLIQHAHAVKNQSVHSLLNPHLCGLDFTYSTHSHLCGTRFDCAADLACSTCQREKVWAVVNPQLVPMHKHRNTLCGKFYYIQALLNCLL